MKNPNKAKFKWYHYLVLTILIIFLLIAGFLSYLSINEYKPDAIVDAETLETYDLPLISNDEIRLVSFNTGYAGLGEESDFILDGGKGTGAEDIETINKNMQGIEAILKKTNADIYMLQEIDQKSNRSFNINQIESYADILGKYNWYYAPNFRCDFVPYPFQAMIKSIDSGIITYTSFKTTEAKRIAMPNPFSWPVRTANLKRCLLLTRMPIANSDQELVIINFHLEAYDDGEGKIAQTKLLLETIANEYAKGNYVIAGGDFNQIFPEVETYVKETSKWVPGNLDPLPAELIGWSYVYDDQTPTCRLLNQPHVPSDPLTQYYVIDGFIVSPNIEVQKVKTLDENFVYSDHNPVVLDFKLRSE